MKNFITAFSLLIVFVVSSCSYSTPVKYLIDNNSSYSITIVSQHEFLNEETTSIIGPGMTIVIFDDVSSEQNLENYLESQPEIPFTVLTITNEDGQAVTKDFLNHNSWSAVTKSSSENYGDISLNLVDADFE